MSPTGAVADAIRRVFEHNKAFKAKDVCASLSGNAVIVKKISLPPMPDEELDGQVKLSAEQYIPFDINEVNLDFHVLPPSEHADEQEEQGEEQADRKPDHDRLALLPGERWRWS